MDSKRQRRFSLVRGVPCKRTKKHLGTARLKSNLSPISRDLQQNVTEVHFLTLVLFPISSLKPVSTKVVLFYKRTTIATRPSGSRVSPSSCFPHEIIPMSSINTAQHVRTATQQLESRKTGGPCRNSCRPSLSPWLTRLRWICNRALPACRSRTRWRRPP